MTNPTKNGSVIQASVMVVKSLRSNSKLKIRLEKFAQVGKPAHATFVFDTLRERKIQN
ncbi:hypothetical protein FDUTEX481_05666 [Tolypothrix sp. PCC 7601]|nr:hypothetical protein FDUTEX481_05666 [Tolypothrix sp. PCC 7601]